MENVIRTITLPWKALAVLGVFIIFLMGLQVIITFLIQAGTVVEERASCTLVSIEPVESAIVANIDCSGRKMRTTNPKTVYALMQDPTKPIVCKLMAADSASSCGLDEPEQVAPED
ncbi:MAG: hypothetical protein KBC38_03275 [Candidatus Pacebacteria bacterium]|nr:hypothetical protein [Candidatus Paceibacterota bacterium]MBP9840567.1 hypothetical protein [Candidatus Paceibacterota bacterium]